MSHTVDALARPRHLARNPVCGSHLQCPGHTAGKHRSTFTVTFATQYISIDGKFGMKNTASLCTRVHEVSFTARGPHAATNLAGTIISSTTADQEIHEFRSMTRSTSRHINDQTNTFMVLSSLAISEYRRCDPSIMQYRSSVP